VGVTGKSRIFVPTPGQIKAGFALRDTSLIIIDDLLIEPIQSDAESM